jgi:hypothetical protein
MTSTLAGKAAISDSSVATCPFTIVRPGGGEPREGARVIEGDREVGRARLLGERSGLAHEGAQVGVLELLDAPVGQAALGEARDGALSR